MRTLSPEIFPMHAWSFCLRPVPHSLKRFIKAITGFGGVERIGLPGTSLVVQWLRLRASKQGAMVRSLVGELISHMPCGMEKKKWA